MQPKSIILPMYVSFKLGHESKIVFKNLIFAVITSIIELQEIDCPKQNIVFRPGLNCVAISFKRKRDVHLCIRNIEGNFGAVFDMKPINRLLRIECALTATKEIEVLQKSFPDLVNAIILYNQGSPLFQDERTISTFIKKSKLISKEPLDLDTTKKDPLADVQKDRNFNNLEFTPIGETLRTEFEQLPDKKRGAVIRAAIRDQTQSCISLPRDRVFTLFHGKYPTKFELAIVTDNRTAVIQYLNCLEIETEVVPQSASTRYLLLKGSIPSYVDPALRARIEKKIMDYNSWRIVRSK